MERDVTVFPNPVPADGGRSMAHAIDVLQQATQTDVREPAITPSSTGVLINTARSLVRKAR